MHVSLQASSIHAAPLRSIARPSSRPRLAAVVRAAADNLEPWQVQKLHEAAAVGRRQVKVEKLCKEVGLPRQTVLQWLKDTPPPDPVQKSLLDARAAAAQAAAERQALLAAAAAGKREAAAASTAGATWGSSAAARRSGAGGSRTPTWKQHAKKKALGKQAEATLEMVFSRTQWPSDEAVSSLWELHRIPREKVVEWFQARRRQDQRRRGAGGSAAAGDAPRPSSPAPATRGDRAGADSEWDAEWSKPE